MYLIRLDDASEYMDIEKWCRIEKILDKYNVKPIVGIIPDNKDKELVNKYDKDLEFWEKVKLWHQKGWEIGLHGYNHIFCTDDGGINPVNNRSEFAGLTLEVQRQKIREGLRILNSQGIYPNIFFSPAHTFDMNTLEALKMESKIRIISDTVANDIYKQGEFYFIPQQAGHVRKLPFKIVTFCYHPNIMNENDFQKLEKFIKKHPEKIGKFQFTEIKDRKLNIMDMILAKSYFVLKKIRAKLRS